MILLMSAFITHDRALNRHNRLDVLMMTLKSYSKISWDRVYLFLKLDTEFLPFALELEVFIKLIFPNTNVSIVWNRFETQKEWARTIKRITSSGNLIWFTQNDDHPFVDINTDLIREGQSLLGSQSGEMASIYLSHWPEILKLSGKNQRPLEHGNFISFRATLLDSIQIFSPALLEYIFLELDWGDRRYKRIDMLLRQNSIWAESGNTDLELQTVYVPLREQCRKFSAYSHVAMNSVSPLTPSFEIIEIDRTPVSVKKLMLARHESEWTRNNQFRIPKSWIKISQNLYK